MANKRMEAVGYRPFEAAPVLADGLLSVQRDDGALERKVAQGLANLADEFGQQADRQAADAGARQGALDAMSGAPGASTISGGQMSGTTASVNGQAGHIAGAQGGYRMLAGDGANQAAQVLRHEEGFIPTPKWDVNAYRVGYGSDTITRPDGTVLAVRPGMTVTRDDAERDLQRRIASGEGARARDQVGADVFDKLPAGAQAGLISTAYNYGSLPDEVVVAAKSGDLSATAQAVRSLSTNTERRGREADLITGSIGQASAPAAATGYVDPQVVTNSVSPAPTGTPAGLLEAGNIDLTKRPQVKNADGTISTVRSMSIEEDGKEVLIPTVSPDGKILSDDDAVKLYRESGQHLGKFDNADDANKYAEDLHQAQERFYAQSNKEPSYAKIPAPASVAPISVTPVRAPVQVTPGKTGTFRPHNDGTIYGRAYDIAGTKTYLQMLDNAMLSDQAQVYEAYKDDPAQLSQALGQLKAKHLQDDVFPEIAPDYTVSFDRQANELVQRSRALADQRKREQDKVDFLGRVQTLEDQKGQRLAALQPNDPTAAASLANQQDLIDEHYRTAVARGLLSPEEAQAYQRKSRSDTVTSFYTQQAANKSPEDILQLRKDMTRDYAAGNLAGVTPDDWERIDKGLVAAASARRTQDNKANEDLKTRGDDIADRVARGLPVDPANLARFQLDAATAPKGKEIVGSTLTRIKFAEALRTQTLAEVQKQLPSILGQGATPDDYDYAQKTIEQHRKDLQTDPLGVAERFGVLPPSPGLPLDGDPDPSAVAGAFAERVNAARAAATHFGVQPKYFRPGEAQQISDAVKDDPQRGLAIAAGLVAAGGRDANKVLAELGTDAPAVSQSGEIIRMGGDPKAALDLITSYGKSPDGKNYADMPVTLRMPLATEVAGGALAFTPDQQVQIDASANAIARKRLYDAGIKPTDSSATKPIYERAYNEAAGAIYANNVQYGGFGSYDPGFWWRSRKVLVPNTIRADRFEDVVQSLNDGDVGQVKAQNGRTWTAGDFKKALPVAVNGGYAFALGDPQGSSPQFIADEKGNPVVLDIAGMKDRLEARNPGAFR
jgi:GH24 family phage-related lysozyme (muramidase)